MPSTYDMKAVSLSERDLRRLDLFPPVDRTAEQERFMAHEAAHNDVHAVWALADLLIPTDIREFGDRHRIPQITEEVWRSAFTAGWRAALAAPKNP